MISRRRCYPAVPQEKHKVKISLKPWSSASGADNRGLSSAIWTVKGTFTVILQKSAAFFTAYLLIKPALMFRHKNL